MFIASECYSDIDGTSIEQRDHHGTISREQPDMKAMLKSELAAAAGVSRKTLMKWLKDPYIQKQMARYSLSAHQKKLPGSLIKIICEHYVIDID